MSAMLKTPQKSVKLEEVQGLMRKLAVYGLGVYVPHIHTDASGFAPLPKDMVSVEHNMKTSFKPFAEVAEMELEPVGWVWNDGVKLAMGCQIDFVSGGCG